MLDEPVKKAQSTVLTANQDFFDTENNEPKALNRDQIPWRFRKEKISNTHRHDNKNLIFLLM
jgi:hypothetical protein